MIRMSFSFLAMLCAFAACGHQSAPNNQPQTVRTIEISDLVQPVTVYARSGQEIRWQNMRPNPVRLGFLSIPSADDLGCKKGVTNLFGEVYDLITIPPGEAVSLCPLRPGVLRYNVWFDADNPRGGNQSDGDCSCGSWGVRPLSAHPNTSLQGGQQGHRAVLDPGAPIADSLFQKVMRHLDEVAFDAKSPGLTETDFLGCR